LKRRLWWLRFANSVEGPPAAAAGGRRHRVEELAGSSFGAGDEHKPDGHHHGRQPQDVLDADLVRNLRHGHRRNADAKEFRRPQSPVPTQVAIRLPAVYSLEDDFASA
jgi:hypothetical protein